MDNWGTQCTGCFEIPCVQEKEKTQEEDERDKLCDKSLVVERYNRRKKNTSDLRRAFARKKKRQQYVSSNSFLKWKERVQVSDLEFLI